MGVRVAEVVDQEAPRGPQVDVVVVGAGFAGLYLLHRLRTAGFSARVFEAADDVGGTWYWNRYPGARCDVPTTDYTYGFDPDLEDDWTWSEKYAAQPEILSYLQHVADRYDLRRDIDFETRVEKATWDDAASRWALRTDRGDEPSCRFSAMATGCPAVSTGGRPAPCRCRRTSTSRAPIASRPRFTSPAGGPTRASTSPAS